MTDETFEEFMSAHEILEAIDTNDLNRVEGKKLARAIDLIEDITFEADVD